MNTQSNKQKLYCYVDETGQDTMGNWFLVSIVIIENDKEKFENILEDIETKSGKRKLKWNKTKRNRREAYIREIIKVKQFKHCFYFTIYENTTLFTDLIVYATAKAILDKANQNYQTNIIVDGLYKNLEKQFSTSLRKLKVKVNKVKGARDESSSLIRLADALAGLLRDAAEGDKISKDLVKKLKNLSYVKEI